jgi:AbrB family looped-hinge helix DNA binding protein
MTTKLSSKGQVVLPKKARMRLRLRPGMTFMCKVQGSSIVLTPERMPTEQPRLEADPKTGLVVTKSPAGLTVTSEDVRAALLEFP